MKRAERRFNPVGGIARRLRFDPRQRVRERIEQAEHGDHHGDHRADRYAGEQRPAGRARDAAKRDLDERAAGNLHLGENPRQAAGARGEMPRPDCVNGRDARSRPHRRERGDERDGESRRRRDCERREIERRPPLRQRQEVREIRPKRPRYGDAENQPENHAEQRHLRAEQQRPERDERRRDAERHADADFAPLGVHHPAREVERRQRRAAEHNRRQNRVELAVAFDVLDHQPYRGVVHAPRDFAAHLRETVFERPRHRVRVRRRRERHYEVVDAPIRARDSLGGFNGRERGGEIRLPQQPALRRNHQKILRRKRVSDV